MQPEPQLEYVYHGHLILSLTTDDFNKITNQYWTRIESLDAFRLHFYTQSDRDKPADIVCYSRAATPVCFALLCFDIELNKRFFHQFLADTVAIGQ